MAGTQWQAVAALVDPVRRALYDHVRRQGHPVTREEAADAVTISRNLTAFHLDKLVDAGLLRARYESPPDRRRGRGRTPKVYEPTDEGVSLSVPPRRYELAGEILAAAVAEQPTNAAAAARDHAFAYGQRIGEAYLAAGTPIAAGTPNSAAMPDAVAPSGAAAVLDAAAASDAAGTAGAVAVPDAVALSDAAAMPDAAGTAGAVALPDAAGTAGAVAMPDAAGTAGAAADTTAVRDVLSDLGFEPRASDPDDLSLGNCPFHTLATRHPELICGLNHALIDGLLVGLGATRLCAQLRPGAGACCVRVTAAVG